MLNRTLPLLVSTLLVLVTGAAFAQEAESPPADVDALVRDGAFYLNRGDCALAQYFYEEALAVAPAEVDALVGRGRALRCQGDLPGAVEALRAATDAAPNDATPWVQLALTYREQYLEDSAGYASRLGDALDAVARAEAVAPDDARVYNTKGIVLYESGALEEARTAFETAADVAAGDEALSNREVSTIRVNQGRVYRDLGDLELAAATFRRGVVDDPTNVAARNLLGNVLYRIGDCPGARYELSQAVTLAPTSLSAVSQLGIALFECGDPAASVPVLERALELEGAVFTPPLYTYLARAYLEQGRADDAVRRAQQGALLPPERAEAHVVLGDAYLARGGDGDTAAAREAYQRALEIDPDDAAAREALAALD